MSWNPGVDQIGPVAPGGGASISVPPGITGLGTYDPIRNLYLPPGLIQLRKTRAALANASAGANVLTRIHLLGDSMTAGYSQQESTSSTAVFLRKVLASQGYSIAGTGIVPTCHHPGGEDSPGDSRLATTGTWNGTASSFQDYTTSLGATFTFSTTASGEVGTAINIYYYDTGSTWSWAVDAGAPTTVTPASSANLKEVQITGLANTTHTVVITQTGALVGGEGPVLAGFELLSASGIAISGLGLSGCTSAQWLESNAPQQSRGQFFVGGYSGSRYTGSLPGLVSPIAANLTIIQAMLFNDIGQGISAAQTLANLETIIADNQATLSECLLFIQPAPAQASDGTFYNTTTSTWTQYRQAVYAAADATGVPLIDCSDRSGLWSAANVAGLMYSDGVHCTAAGYNQQAQAILAAIRYDA